MENLNKTLQAVTENGQQLSPVLPEGVKNYLIDIELFAMIFLMKNQKECLLQKFIQMH